MKPDLPPNTPRYRHQQLADLERMFGDAEAQPSTETPPLIDADDPREAQHKVWDGYYRAWHAMEKEARDAGLSVDGQSTLYRMFAAGHDLAGYWMTRTKALDRTLRHVLASDFVDDDKRAAILAVLCGKASIGRDPKMLSATEAALIQNYRASAAAGKQMLRTLLSRLAVKDGTR